MKRKVSELIKKSDALFDWKSFNHLSFTSLESFITNSNALFKDPLFDFSIVTGVVSNFSHFPDCFLLKIDGEFVLVNRLEEVFITEDKRILKDEDWIEAEIIFIEENPKKITVQHMMEILYGFFPKVNFILLLAAPFVLIPAFYANLFNTRMIYNDSSYTLIFLTFCFSLIWSVDYFLKKYVKNFHLSSIDKNALKIEKYFYSLIPFSRLSENLVKIRIVESNRKIIWDNMASVIVDVVSFILVFFVLTALLGIASLYLLIFYLVLVFVLVLMRYRNYRIYLDHEAAQQDMLTERISVCKNVNQLRFFDFNSSFAAFESACKKIFRSDHSISHFNFNWDEMVRFSSFLASFTLFFVVFYQSKIDVTIFTVLIALLVLNGRMSASITGLVTKFFYILVSSYHVKKSLEPLFDNISENCFVKGMKLESIKNIQLKNVNLSVSERLLLSNVNISFIQANTYGIFGVVGSGKSTLVSSILNMHDEYRGNITYNNFYEARTIDRHCFADHVCYIDINSDFVKGSIFHNFYIRGIRDKETIVKISRSIFPTVAIDYEFIYKNDISQYPMSSGQKRKLLLYMSISASKSLIILDEALVNLSIEDVIALRKYIANLTPKAIVIIVTHDRAILNLLPNIFQLDNGSIKLVKSSILKIN